MLPPRERVDEDGEHLVHHADHRVRGRGDELLALEARPRDAEAAGARETEPQHPRTRPLDRAQPVEVAAAETDYGGGDQGESVRVEHRRPRRLEAEGRDEPLGVRQLEDQQPKPHEHPEIGLDATELEGLIIKHVVGRAGEDEQHCTSGAQVRQRALVEEVVEDTHSKRRTRTKDDDRLHIRVHQHAHVRPRAARESEHVHAEVLHL
mmetsp:Transcript_25708/g.59984  ORF Transcript_25708/g.59984 Transcript_25708/m.59984 type:complete len:207 (+) Transcript_25708:447-1067(+)